MKYDWYGVYVSAPYGGFKRGDKGVFIQTDKGKKLVIRGYKKSLQWLHKPLKDGHIKRMERVYAVCQISSEGSATLRVVPEGGRHKLRQAG